MTAYTVYLRDIRIIAVKVHAPDIYAAEKAALDAWNNGDEGREIDGFLDIDEVVQESA